MALNKLNDPALLGLPLELLQCIISRLTDESLLPLRFACKSLESAALDRFAAPLHAWLAGFEKSSVLTGKILENVQRGALPTVASERWKKHDPFFAQYAAARTILEEAACETTPAPEFMVQVRRDVRRNAPGARIIMDLTCDSSSDLAEERSHQQAMFEDVVVVSSRLELPLGALWLGALSAALLARLANQKEICLLPVSSISGLRAFVFEDSKDRESVDESQSEIGQLEDRVAVAGNILKSTKELHSLVLAFDHVPARCLTTCRLD